MSNQQSSHLISLHKDGLYLLDLNETTLSKLDLPFTLPAKTEPACILHCRGMMCLTLKDNNDLAIWKPGSDEFKRIPMVIRGQTTNLLGFGYDRISDDYKIVTIIGFKTYIYAFKESCWRESVRETSLHCKFKNQTGTVVDHCMYWIADRSHTKNPRRKNTILCFDFVKEEYQELLSPMYAESKFSSWLGVLRGELCVIDHYPCLNNDICLWRPQRKGKEIMHWNLDPWTVNENVKAFNIFNVKRFKKFDVGFACIARNEELFIVVKGNGKGEDKFMVYDERQEEFTEVPIGGSLEGFRCMSIYDNRF
ncbi:F-box associated domain type 1 [Arabidopsis thaliana x Arabidopsis arenosa]|uniref:F-box associated domain type 1 n=1 Tax=Arabidopsis thaliana x Arabidopsis arenosa TaxID=1240361 RepID=A0A8T2BJC4_9BRAS|nr:F-box associated domain type 1 [Arabidopsis thaliana x Arabidopsis arenosa]